MPYETRSRTGKKPPAKEVKFNAEASAPHTTAAESHNPRRKGKTEADEQPKKPVVKKGKSASKQSKSKKPSSGSSNSEASTGSSAPISRNHLHILTETEEEDDDDAQIIPHQNEMLPHRAQYGKLRNFLQTLGSDPGQDKLKKMYKDIAQKTEERLKVHLSLKEQEKIDPQGAIQQTPLGKKLMSVRNVDKETARSRKGVVESTIKEMNESFTSESSMSTIASTATNASETSRSHPKTPKTPARKLRNRKMRNSFLVVKSPWAKQRVTRGAAKKLAAKREKEKEIEDIIAKELRDERATSATLSSQNDEIEVEIVEVLEVEPKGNRVKRKVDLTVEVVNGITNDFYVGDSRALNPSAKKRRMEKCQHQKTQSTRENSGEVLKETKIYGVADSMEPHPVPSNAIRTVPATETKSSRPPLPPKKKESRGGEIGIVKSQSSSVTKVVENIRSISPNQNQPSVPLHVPSEENTEPLTESIASSTAKLTLVEPTIENTMGAKVSKPEHIILDQLNPFVLVERMSDLTLASAVVDGVPKICVEVVNSSIPDSISSNKSSKSSKSGAPSKKKKPKKLNMDKIVKGTSSASSKVSSTSSTTSAITVKETNDTFKIPVVPECFDLPKSKAEKVSGISSETNSQTNKAVEDQKSESIFGVKNSAISASSTSENSISKYTAITSTDLVADINVSVTNQTFVVPKQLQPTKTDGSKKMNEIEKLESLVRGFDGSTKVADTAIHDNINSTYYVVPTEGNVKDPQTELKASKSSVMHLKNVAQNLSVETPTSNFEFGTTFVMPDRVGKANHGLPAAPNYNQNHTYVVGNTTFDIETPPRNRTPLDQNVKGLMNEPNQNQHPQATALNLPTAKPASHGSTSEVDPSLPKQNNNVVPLKKVAPEVKDNNKFGALNQKKVLNSQLSSSTDAEGVTRFTRSISSNSFDSTASTASVSTVYSVASGSSSRGSPSTSKKLVPVKKQSPPRAKAQEGNAKPNIVSAEKNSKATSSSSGSSSSSACGTSSASTITSVSRTPTRKALPVKKTSSKEKVAQDSSAPVSSHTNKPPLVPSASDLDLKKLEEYQRLTEKTDEGIRKKELIIQQKKEMQRKKNEEWKAKIEKKKAEDNKHHQAIIEKSKGVGGNIEGFVKAAVQVFTKPFANPRPGNPPTLPFKSGAIPKHMLNTLPKAGASSLPDIHEASDAGSSSSGHPLKKSSPAQKALFGSVGQLPGVPLSVPKSQLAFPTKKSVYHPALAQSTLKSKPLTPVLSTKAPYVTTATIKKQTVNVMYPFDTTENDDENESFKTADMTVDLENEVISSYDITRYEDLDEDNRHRENKPVPDWASNGDKLNMSLFYQQPELIRYMQASCFPRKNVGYRLFPNVRH